jgi:predicted ATPase
LGFLILIIIRFQEIHLKIQTYFNGIVQEFITSTTTWQVRGNTMKASAILLRWYKSFNINYLGYADRQPDVVLRPWNTICSPNQNAYRFIEIPLRPDITTIVGANESGKSHLLSALNKVINGIGIPEEDGTATEFNVTDLCHYASVKDKNATGWPNVGAIFEKVSAPEISKLAAAAGVSLPTGQCDEVTLVLAHDSKQEAMLYFGRDSSPVPLDNNTLADVRKLLPSVEFIRSNTPLASELPIDDLLSNATNTNEPYVAFELAQAAAKLIETFTYQPDKKVSDELISSFNSLQSRLKNRPLKATKNSLASQLFEDVLGLDGKAIELLASTKTKDRGFAEGLVATWNSELDRVLNLRRFWQQDDQFSLSLNYKAGWFYFEIRDKTGSVYTFRERSSGLRYFLSYYIQAKSIEKRHQNKDCIILMDEPDSFLSIAAQKNLLAVFESLVSPTQGNANLQLIYTTHSPFLINANYAHRIRLVKKGDAEEGSQIIQESMLRRYEPIRSALGIDCAQTLFMGEANILLEGASDQFAVTELIRLLARYRPAPPILDLTTTVVMSAESASGIAKVLDASKWGEERIPATVVLFDSDDEGHMQKDRVIGKMKRSPKLIEEKFVVLIGDAIPSNAEQQIVSTEDIFPRKFYAEAVLQYIKRWYPEKYEVNETAITTHLKNSEFGRNGNASDTQALFNAQVFDKNRDYDKMGVFQTAIELLEVIAMKDPNTVYLLVSEERLNTLLSYIRRKLEQSKQESKKQSARQSIIRTSDDFFKRFKNGAEAFEIELHLERIIREVDSIGDDSATLSKVLTSLLKEIKEIHASGNSMIDNQAWNRWSSLLFAIKKNPLSPEISLSDDKAQPLNLWDPGEDGLLSVPNTVSPNKKATDVEKG